MVTKGIVRGVSLAIVVGSLAFVALRGRGTGEVAANGGTEPSAAAVAAAKVVVTYFTTDVRCVSCRTIEALAQRAVVEGFPAELARGEVVFRIVNTSRPEHAHFIERYQITNKTVVVAHQQDGKELAWTGRQEVWSLFQEPERFLTYVREPVKAYLGGS
jgi:hypothetical protein